MPPWLPIVASLIGGGACGAVVKMVYDHWRDRRQPVAYRVSTDSVFTSAPHVGILQANAQVSYDGQTYPFESLALIRVELKNKGNRDLNTFAFGITLEGEHQAVLCVSDGDDRHHQIREIEPNATPAQPRNAIDFSCTPFNRRDHYTVRLYVRNNGDVNADQVKMSTAIPIRFSRVQSVDEQGFLSASSNSATVMTTAITSLVLAVGALALSFGDLFQRREMQSDAFRKMRDEDGRTIEYRIVNPGPDMTIRPHVRINGNENEASKQRGSPSSTQNDTSK